MSNEHLLFNTGPVKSSSSSFFFVWWWYTFLLWSNLQDHPLTIHLSVARKTPRHHQELARTKDSTKRYGTDGEFGASCWFKVCYTRWGTGRNLGTILKHRKTWRRCPNYDPLPCRRTSVLVRVQHQPVVCNANDAFVGGSDTMLLMLLQSIQFSA